MVSGSLVSMPSAQVKRSKGLCLRWCNMNLTTLDKMISMIKFRSKLKIRIDIRTGPLTPLNSSTKSASWKYFRIFKKYFIFYWVIFHTLTWFPNCPCISIQTSAKFDWALHDMCHSSFTSKSSKKHICLFKSGLRALVSPKWFCACGWTHFIIWSRFQKHIIQTTVGVTNLIGQEKIMMILSNIRSILCM